MNAQEEVTLRRIHESSRRKINQLQVTNPSAYNAEHGDGAYTRDLNVAWATLGAASTAYDAGSEQADAGTTGNQTLADLPYGLPPAQLVAPFLTPEGVTILYGPGGTGKGVFSTYMVWQLVRAGNRVMVIDYEHHEAEWGRRARGMGFTEDELAMVVYRAPFGPEWTAKKGSLHEVSDLIREDCDAHGVGFLVIDSYTTATSTGDAMGGQAAAQEFFGAIARIGRPALVIAHVAGASGRFPERPFGSVFVHNLARETWAIEKVSADNGEPYDPAIAHLMPLVIALELRNKKMNNGARPNAQFITFSFNPDGTIEVDRVQPKPTSVLSRISEVLLRSTKGLTAAEIAKIIKADVGESIDEDTIRKTLNRHSGTTFQRSDDTPYRWSMKTVRA